MKPAALLILILVISQSILAQTRVQNIVQGYLITIGARPDAGKIKEMQENRKLDAGSLNDVIIYLNNYIFEHRATVQKAIIRRAYYTVFRIYPLNQDVEDLYCSTEKKGKNFTDFINEFKTYFKDGVTEPE